MPRRDPISILTLAELDAGSRLLKADFVFHLTSPGAPRKWEAVAIAAWLLERRGDPSASVSTYRSMTSEEVEGVLASYANTPGAGDEPSAEETLAHVREYLGGYVDAGQPVVDVAEVLDLLGSAEVDTGEDEVDTTGAAVDTAPAPVDTAPASPEAANPTDPPPVSSSPGHGASVPPTSPTARSANTPR